MGLSPCHRASGCKGFCLSTERTFSAGIGSVCSVSNNAHEHHEWPFYPIPKHEGVKEKELLKMEVLFKEGT